MDGECLKADSDFLQCDMISELPEEIIIHILSYLSFKEAAATSLLSPRWSNLWKHTPNLIFTSGIFLNSNNPTSSWDAERCKYVKLVNSVIQSHKALFLKQFKISFYVNKSAQSHVDKWLEFLFSRRVESVELDFKCWEKSDKVNVVLEEFLRESRMSESLRTDNILAKSLKKLSLSHLKVRGEDIELFLRNFPLLKKLYIHFSVFTSDFEVCGLKLERLIIFGCRGGKSIKISAPNLKWIRYTYRERKLSFVNVPKLVEAEFNIRISKFVEHLSCCISQLQILSICLPYHKVILVKNFVEMPNLKKLTVTYLGAYNQTLMPLTTLLWASPRLEEFKLQFIGDDDDDATIGEMEVNVERSSHKHLKVFEFQGSCSGIGDQIVELVTYTSDNCVPLQKIIIGGRVLGLLVYGNPPHSTSKIEARELQSDRDYVKEQLQGKLPHHIQMQFLEYI